MDTKAVTELSLSVRARIPVIAISTKNEEKSLELVKRVATELERGLIVWKITEDHKVALSEIISGASVFSSRAILPNWDRRGNLIIVYDLYDIIKTDVRVKRSLIEHLSGISGCRNVLITFTDTTPDISWMHAMNHKTTLSESEIKTSIRELMAGVDKQVDYITERIQENPNDKNRKNWLAEIINMRTIISEQLKDGEDKIIEILCDPRSNLTMHQVESILSRCLVARNFTLNYVITQTNNIILNES